MFKRQFVVKPIFRNRIGEYLMSFNGKKVTLEECYKGLETLNPEQLQKIIDAAIELKFQKLGKSPVSSVSSDDVYFGSRTDHGNATLSLFIKGKPDHNSPVDTVNVRMRRFQKFSTVFQSYTKRTNVTEGSLHYFTPSGKMIGKLDTPDALGLTDGDTVTVKFANLH